MVMAGGGCGGEASSTSTTRGAPRVGQSESGQVTGSLGKFGVRANAAQEKAAAEALVGYQRARVDREWRLACSYVSLPARRLLLKAVEHMPGQQNVSCPKALATFLSVPPPSQRDDFLTVDPVVLKLKGSTGILVYHGGEADEYAIQMIVEDRDWKVGSLAPVPLS